MATNQIDSAQQQDELKARISSSLEKARTQKNALKRKSSRCATANLVLGAIAAALAGVAGTVGKASTWKPLCLTAAVCSIGVTVTAKLQTTDELIQASECVGQLKALQIETIFPTYDSEKVLGKYQQILSEFSTIDC